MVDDAVASFLSPALRQRLRTAWRQAIGVLTGGVLGAGVWLVVVQQGREWDLTDVDFVRGVATIFGSDGVDRRAVGSYGLYVTLAMGVILVAVHALAGTRLVRRGWWYQTVPLAALSFLLWAVVMSPTRPSGLFGLSAGGITSPAVFLVGGAAFAIVAVRCYSLITGSGWWEEKHEDISAGLDKISATRRPSLELPEERPEEGRVGPGS